MNHYLRLIEKLSIRPDSDKLSIGRRQEKSLINLMVLFIKALPERVVDGVIHELCHEIKRPAEAFFKDAEKDVEYTCPDISGREKAVVIERLCYVRYCEVNKKRDGYREKNRSTIDRWTSSFNAYGIRGLIPGKSSGRPRKSTNSQGV